MLFVHAIQLTSLFGLTSLAGPVHACGLVQGLYEFKMMKAVSDSGDTNAASQVGGLNRIHRFEPPLGETPHDLWLVKFGLLDYLSLSPTTSIANNVIIISIMPAKIVDARSRTTNS